ncbi:MAG: pseudouridine synthase [Lachnospirales bacterium]
MERLDKVLVNKRLGSRKEVHCIIKKGAVSVNGVTVTDKNTKIDNTMEVMVAGKKLNLSDFVYIVMNKPKGVVSATKDKCKTVFDLLNDEYKQNDLFLVGRLDKDTTGLILITNDGKFGSYVLSPKHHVAKKYYVEVIGELEEKHIDVFLKGIVFKDYTSKEAKLEIICKKVNGVSKCYVTITEGKFHQVKKMFASIGCEVVNLKRVTFGEIDLDENLQEGEYRYADTMELEFINKVKKSFK